MGLVEGLVSSILSVVILLFSLLPLVSQLKKWAARIVTHFIQRYGNPRYSGEENKAFSEHFRAHTAKLLLEPMVNLLIQKSQGIFLTDTVHRMCITYVCNSVEMSPTYKVLKPHIEFLLFGVIFPTLSLKESDIR
jgi:importin-7